MYWSLLVMIVKIGKNHLDTKEIAIISGLNTSDPNWENYTITLKSGKEIKVYEDCHRARNRDMDWYIPRKELMSNWLHDYSS